MKWRFESLRNLENRVFVIPFEPIYCTFWEKNHEGLVVQEPDAAHNSQNILNNKISQRELEKLVSNLKNSTPKTFLIRNLNKSI